MTHHVTGDFPPDTRVRVEGYDAPDSRAVKIDGEEGTVVVLDESSGGAYVAVKLDTGALFGIKVWLFAPNELVKI